MPSTSKVANTLASVLKGRLAAPEHAWHWRNLAQLDLPGLEFIGNWRKDELSPGDMVVATARSETTSHPAIVVGTVGSNVDRYNFCVPIEIKAVLTPKEESAESAGLTPGKTLLFGGFQVFRYRGRNKKLAAERTTRRSKDQE